MTKFQKAAKKAWQTRRKLYGPTGLRRSSRSAAAFKAWETRRENEHFAKKAWKTRKANAS